MGAEMCIRDRTVQLNLTWGPFDSLATTDIWLDDTSFAACKEIQRHRHLRLIRSRFLPGWVDTVKNYDNGGGEITITLFGDMDPELYADIRDMKKRKGNLKIAIAFTTLRTWSYHQENASPGEILEWNETENPPAGSSGFQVRLKVKQMLDGFRPGWIVRVKGPWTYVLVPKDETVMSLEGLERSKKMILP